MQRLNLALDWTPNINHLIFFVGREKGIYEEAGVDLNIINPADDNYQTTPAKKVERGLVNLALCPTESLISYRTKKDPFPLSAIGSIYEHDCSAIVSLKREDINSPKDLDGKSYASYQARYEDEIVKQMIKNDGGEGKLNLYYPNKLGIWDTIVNKEYDVTWIFVNWEGVQAAEKNINLQNFKLEDYGIPYSYSPVIAGDENHIDENPVLYKSFLKASRKAFDYTLKHTTESLDILKRYVPDSDKDIPLEKAFEVSKKHFIKDGEWGEISLAKIQDFLNWVYKQGLEKKKLKAGDIVY